VIVPAFSTTAAVATAHEAQIARAMHDHDSEAGHKSRMPKSEPHGGGRRLHGRDTVEFRVLTVCAMGEQTPGDTKPDNVSNSKWSTTFHGLHRKKMLDRKPISRTGARYLYMITPKGLAALKAWGEQ
jgi:hypothetical protein